MYIATREFFLTFFSRLFIKFDFTLQINCNAWLYAQEKTTCIIYNMLNITEYILRTKKIIDTIDRV